MLKHILNSKWSRNFAQLSVILFFCMELMAQTTPRPEACSVAELGDPSDFVVVDENRGRLQRELPELKAKAKDLKENKIPQAEKAEKDLRDTNAKIESLAQVPPDLEKFKISLEGLLAGKSVETLTKELKETNDEISQKETQLKCVNSDMRKVLITPEQKFKGDMSFYFAIIIFSLIAGFFAMGWRYKSVGRGNFSGQIGLQFVTLFSIVIAIILFGITGILEAKELAALLGGLSGYILGRHSVPQSSHTGQNMAGSGSRLSPATTRIATVTISPATTALTSTMPTQQLTVAVKDALKKPIADLPKTTFHWFSDDPAVATVSQSGLVTRVAPGKCNVKAIANGLASNACVVTCE